MSGWAGWFYVEDVLPETPRIVLTMDENGTLRALCFKGGLWWCPFTGMYNKADGTPLWWAELPEQLRGEP